MKLLQLYSLVFILQFDLFVTTHLFHLQYCLVPYSNNLAIPNSINFSIGPITSDHDDHNLGNKLELQK